MRECKFGLKAKCQAYKTGTGKWQIRAPCQTCPLIKGQKNLNGGEIYMVKLKEIPSEGDRVDLKDLPQENILMAVEEHFTEPKEGKVGGLIITYKQKDGKTLMQKYSKVSGKVLIEALEKLGYDDTVALQKAWHKYVMTPMRSGYPRYIPVAKA